MIINRWTPPNVKHARSKTSLMASQSERKTPFRYEMGTLTALVARMGSHNHPRESD